ncbi:MAG: 16S rRNA (cytosine(1402)-N(4))-methyltransferase RsmH [Clostridia bacterium]|nr:16S rRNA (cytosine(1402)-N(4))-methyltransferase RsmH [Clostridia bacterium]
MSTLKELNFGNSSTGKELPQFSHKPVLLEEVLDALSLREDGMFLDGTVGGAGHSSAIASKLTTGKLIALDRDDTAIAVARERLSRFGDRAEVVKSNFVDIAKVCKDKGIEGLDGILLDLGVSSHQLDTPERGFSYMHDAPLDMRMDRTAPIDAAYVVNNYDRQDLIRIIRDYGEEKLAVRIADKICRRREERPIERTGELVDIIRSAYPDGGRSIKHHPAMRTFQAIRIEVNGELEIIGRTVKDAVSLLAPGGRLAIITFHSLEDRAVKEAFAELAQGCTCPRDFPICVCGKKPQIRIVSKKPITSTAEELRDNPRAHSAKLRVAEKI